MFPRLTYRATELYKHFLVKFCELFTIHLVGSSFQLRSDFCFHDEFQSIWIEVSLP
jgi:hypothetical protein